MTFHIQCVYFVKLVRVPRIRFLSESPTATEVARKFPFPRNTNRKTL
jgi:hypothetical protein